MGTFLITQTPLPHDRLSRIWPTRVFTPLISVHLSWWICIAWKSCSTLTHPISILVCNQVAESSDDENYDGVLRPVRMLFTFLFPFCSVTSSTLETESSCIRPVSLVDKKQQRTTNDWSSGEPISARIFRHCGKKEKFLNRLVWRKNLTSISSLGRNLCEKVFFSKTEMSKKFGINSKSAEARARQDAVKQSNERDKQQKLEDEYWKDDDKQVQKKQQRKVCSTPLFDEIRNDWFLHS